MNTARPTESDLTRWGSRTRDARRRGGGAALTRLAWILIALIAAIVFADAARADSIRLLEEAGATSARVRLSQVAELLGERARALADVVVLTLHDDQERAVLTLTQLREVLDDAEANWARLSLRGFTRCRITRVPRQKPVAVEPDPVVSSNVETALDAERPTALEGVLREQLAAMLGVSEPELQVELAERDRQKLASMSAAGRLEIEPLKRALLGRTTIRLRRYEGVDISETITFVAQVSRRSMALVATQAVAKGAVIPPEAVELREVLIDDGRTQPMVERALVAGQIAASGIKPGDVITPKSLRPVLLVKRGEMIKIRTLAGGLVVRVAAIALEDGGKDDVISARNQASREKLAARVSGVREASVIHEPADSQPQKEMTQP